MTKKTVSTLLAGALAVTFASAANAASSTDAMEKCYGVVKAGKNDCGTKAHSCAGQSKTDGDKTEWLYLPKGACDKLTNGSLTSSEE